MKYIIKLLLVCSFTLHTIDDGHDGDGELERLVAETSLLLAALTLLKEEIAHGLEPLKSVVKSKAAAISPALQNVPAHIADLRRKVDATTDNIKARLISLTRDVNAKHDYYEHHMKEVRSMIQWERFKLVVCTPIVSMLIAGILAWFFSHDQDCGCTEINSSVHELE